MKQIAKIIDSGFYMTIAKTDAAVNPYRVYKHYPTFEKGYPTWHKEMQVKYADLKSCLHFIAVMCNG